MKMRVKQFGGFTLIEVLIASSIGMLAISMTWKGFRHIDRMIKRQESVIRMNGVAGGIARLFQADLRSMQNNCAFALESPSADFTTDQTFTWMRSLDQRDPARLLSPVYEHPLVWVQWKWNKYGLLSRAISPPPATGLAEESGVGILGSSSIAEGEDYMFGAIPTPQRVYANLKDGYTPFYYDGLWRGNADGTHGYWSDVSVSNDDPAPHWDMLFLTGIGADHNRDGQLDRVYSGAFLEINSDFTGSSRDTFEWTRDSAIDLDLDGVASSDFDGNDFTTKQVPGNWSRIAENITSWSTRVSLVNGAIVTDATQVSDGVYSGQSLTDPYPGTSGSIRVAEENTYRTGLRNNRPTSIRIDFTLRDPSTDLEQDFSFVFKCP